MDSDKGSGPMPENLHNAVNNLPPWVGGLLMAITVSILRVIYDREETSFVRMMLESLICGALTVAAGSAIAAAGFGDGWYLFAGGMIGFMGSQSIRALAYKFVTRKIDGK